MRKNMPYMVLDITKKPGDHNAVKTGDMLLAENAKLREALEHIKDRLPHMLQYMRVHWEDASAGGYFDELMLVIDAALDATEKGGGAK